MNDEMQEVEVTRKYRIKIPMELFNQLDHRDDSSLTELIAIMQSRIDVGNFKAIRPYTDLVDTEEAIGTEILQVALADLGFDDEVLIDWEGNDHDWNWEGV